MSEEMSTANSETEGASKKATITLRGAVFIGIGSMVGAGIFALFGEAGTIAGAAVWVSFLIGGIIALLQGYSFAKLGARYPSSGGMIAWIVRGYRQGTVHRRDCDAGLFFGADCDRHGGSLLWQLCHRLFLGEDATPFG